jgi:hypothetical protein
MKFSLALFFKYKGHVILLLLLCIFISLLLSDIPWIINFLNNKNTQEGMVSDDSINTMNKILNDKYATNTQKLSAIKSLTDIMENLKDQTQYLTILNDGTKNEKEKIDDITKLVDSYLNSTSSLVKSSTANLKNTESTSTAESTATDSTSSNTKDAEEKDTKTETD